MSASVFIVRGGEKFAVNCASILESFNGHFKVKFTDVLCPNCGVAETPWMPVEKVAPTAAPADCPANVPPPADELPVPIGKTPWKTTTYRTHAQGLLGEVKFADGVKMLVDAKAADATMAGAAPKLYDGLREAVIESCHNCPSCGGYPDYACLAEKGSCFVQCWRATLAEAAGMRWGTK